MTKRAWGHCSASRRWQLGKHVCVCIYIYICVHTCISVYMCIHMHTYTYMFFMITSLCTCYIPYDLEVSDILAAPKKLRAWPRPPCIHRMIVTSHTALVEYIHKRPTRSTRALRRAGTLDQIPPPPIGAAAGAPPKRALNKE